MEAELCDPVVEVVAGAEEEEEDALGVTAGAFETEEEEEEGEDALGVSAGAFKTEGEEGDDTLGVTAGALVTEGEEGDDKLGVTAGALVTEEGENIPGVGADEVDGARVTVGAGVTDALGDPAVYVTFLTTASSGSQK